MNKLRNYVQIFNLPFQERFFSISSHTLGKICFEGGILVRIYEIGVILRFG